MYMLKLIYYYKHTGSGCGLMIKLSIFADNMDWALVFPIEYLVMARSVFSILIDLVTDNGHLVIPAGPRKVGSIITCPLALLLSVVAVISFGIFVAYRISQFPEDNQNVNFDIVYSTFSDITPFLYKNIMVDVHGDHDGFLYELTICQPQCPLKTQTEFLTLDGDCWIGRSTINCYARVNHYSSQTTEAQFITTHMLKNSMVTFRINASNVVLEPVKLCVTNTSNKCAQVFQNPSGNLTQMALNQLCYEVLTCNETNNYTQTFVTHDDGYYCAVWLLNSKNQQIRYTTDSKIDKYNITSFDSSQAKCKTYNLNGLNFKTNYGLVGSRQKLCPVIQLKRKEENSNFGPSMIIKTTAVKRLSDRASMILIIVCVIVITISIVTIITIVCIIVCCKVCRCRI